MNSPSRLDESYGNPSRMISEDDFASDMDPMLEAGAYRVMFHRLCPLEVRQKDEEGREYGTRDMLTIRIMSTPSHDNHGELKVQISSENDLYMVFECKVDERKFERIRKMQSLNFNYNSLLGMLTKQLNLCDKYPEQYLLVLYLNHSCSHQLTFVENIEYKSIELLSLAFDPINADLKKQYLLYRFTVLKAKNQKVEQNTNEMLAMVKLKNQNLLQTIAKKTNSTVMNASSLLSMVSHSRTVYK